MARRHRTYHRRAGYERAKEHIRAAQQLSHELGGTDQDVKQYFFSLDRRQLAVILDEYQSRHGQSARDYASTTFNNWKNGSVQMSGVVAERLFSLLPPHMPLQTKYHLTESLWNHVGPTSKKTYYVGIDANLQELQRTVRDHLENVVTKYTIPQPMEKRFSWLAQGDVGLKQELLNHLRQQDKTLLSSVLNSNLPILIEHVNADKADHTSRAAQILAVGKHQVEVVVDKRVTGITENAPRIPANFTWVWWLVAIAFILWALNR